MNGSEAVLFDIAVGCFGLVDETPDVCAVGHTGWRAVVACGQDILIPDDNGPDLCAGTGGTFGHLLRYRHEILIPA